MGISSDRIYSMMVKMVKHSIMIHKFKEILNYIVSHFPSQLQFPAKMDDFSLENSKSKDHLPQQGAVHIRKVILEGHFADPVMVEKYQGELV